MARMSQEAGAPYTAALESEPSVRGSTRDLTVAWVYCTCRLVWWLSSAWEG